RDKQRVRYPRRDGSITLRRGQSALGKSRIIVAMNQVMNDARMVGILLPQLFKDGGCLELFREACVVRRRITDTQDRESVESLYFKIIRILVAQLMHRFFVSDHTIARSDWPVT